MSRISEIAFFVKKDLSDTSINFDEIVFAINKGQEDIALKDDVIEYSQQITLLANQKEYSLLVPIGTEPNIVNKDLIKKIKSIIYPAEWIWETEFLTDKQFDRLKSIYQYLTYPYYATVRNGNLEFHSATPASVATKVLTLQCALKKPTQDAVMFGTVIEPETPSDFDTALRYYADWYMTPFSNPNRELAYLLYDNERKKFTKQSTNETVVPECNW